MSDLLAVYATHIPLWEITLRLVLASLFVLPIGIDREVRRRSAGLRTHLLVSLAAATFTLGTFEIVHMSDLPTQGLRMDPIRLVGAITAGVAFLAAGAIIRARGQVKGLTTGAGMWMAGAIGMICGLGLYAFALVAAIISGLIISALRWLESHGNDDGSG